MKTTITEALAELKTITKKIANNHEFVKAHLLREEGIKDPLRGAGGQEENVKRTRQSIKDLEARAVAIRLAITRSNLATDLKIDERQGSVAEWLVWRREIAAGQEQFLRTMIGNIDNIRNKALREGRHLVKDGEGRDVDIVVNVDETELQAELEAITNVLGVLDGRLSVLNATTHVDI